VARSTGWLCVPRTRLALCAGAGDAPAFVPAVVDTITRSWAGTLSRRLETSSPVACRFCALLPERPGKRVLYELLLHGRKVRAHSVFGPGRIALADGSGDLAMSGGVARLVVDAMGRLAAVPRRPVGRYEQDRLEDRDQEVAENGLGAQSLPQQRKAGGTECGVGDVLGNHQPERPYPGAARWDSNTNTRRRNRDAESARIRASCRYGVRHLESPPAIQAGDDR
jgi:hypothetical protein